MEHHLRWCHVGKVLKEVKESQDKEPGGYVGEM